MSQTKARKAQLAKRKTVRGAAVLDKWGAGGRKPQDELDWDVRHLNEMCDVNLKMTLHERIDQIPEGTNFLLFDYGGAGMTYGPNPMVQQIRALLKWAEDHPNGLAIVTSSYTWDRVAQAYEHIWEEMDPDRWNRDDDGLTQIPNLLTLHPMRGDRDIAYERIKEFVQAQ